MSQGLDLIIERRNRIYPSGVDTFHPYVPCLLYWFHGPVPCSECAQMEWHRLHKEENSK